MIRKLRNWWLLRRTGLKIGDEVVYCPGNVRRILRVEQDWIINGLATFWRKSRYCPSVALTEHGQLFGWLDVMWTYGNCKRLFKKTTTIWLSTLRFVQRWFPKSVFIWKLRLREIDRGWGQQS